MKWLRILFHTLGGSLSLALSAATAAVLAVLIGVALWASSEGSLAQALQLVAPLLPAGQSLQASEVQGSVRDGGRIRHVVWKRGQLSVEAHNLELAWDWRAALGGELRLTMARAAVLHIDDRTPSNTEPLSPIGLPLRVDALVAVDVLEWAGPPALRLEAVKGHYRFDGAQHVLEQASLRMASGNYQLDGQLQANAPGALRLRVSGVVQAPVRIQQQALVLDASATLGGNLYGKDAALELVLDLQPQGAGKARLLGAMQAHLQASLRPAASQPVASAQGQWTALDLASLWPQAPQTSLSGQAQLLPDSAGWEAEVQVQNALEGPLNQNRLPLKNATASVLYRQGQWLLQALQAAVAGGSVTAQGDAGTAWSARGSLRGLDPARLDARWAAPPLDGEVSAQQTAQGIAFDAQLQTAGKAQAALAGTRLQAKGLWSSPLLTLDSLLLQTPDAQISGPLQIDTRSYATRAQLSATLPGAQGSVNGTLEPAQGQGSSAWKVHDARALLDWLSKLPGLGDAAKDLGAQGDAELTAQWTGGWQNQGADLRLNATVQSQRLDLQALHLSDTHLDASGTLRTLALQLRSKLQVASTQTTLQTQAQLTQTSATQWHARVNSLQANVSDGLQPTPWNLQLQQPLELDWQCSALAQTLGASAGTLRMRGPAPGTAQLQWEPAQWTRQGSGATAAARWTSKGSLQGVPLAWLEALGQTRLANLGLRGDLQFGGQWDANGGDGLQLQARVQRSSGDLQLLSADANGSALPAGLRDAHVAVQIARDAVQAELVWDSEAGGTVRADLRTQLARTGTLWPGDAPLQGTLKASLPRVGAWSMLAPVGWRINGTLDADAVLAGTRASPQWTGKLEAHDMAIRSVVDGIDLSQGVLRVRLDGQHMEVAEFKLLGAGGASGGQVVASGAVDWLPAVPGTPLAQRLRMALDARAQAFRVTARPDQRLVLSGKLNATLQDAKLTLRGALAADQALIVLPEDTAPRLGTDVVVKRSKSAVKSAAPANDPSSRFASAVQPDLVVTLDPGPNFQLQGHGINTRLEGLLTLKSQSRELTPRLTGELRTVNGSYRAYGQRLTIEEGTLRFGGAYDNPALDIRAVRPNLQQVVGVQVSGTAQLPVVRLFAEPELTEMEKLSWLVLGRSSANGGGETAILQQAALALFAGNKSSRSDNLINAVGLDEVSLGQTATTNLDGTAGTEATVKFGKRLSRDFYVAYERSLAGTLGTLYVFYDLSRRFTLRGESGTTNAVDLIFTTRYD